MAQSILYYDQYPRVFMSNLSQDWGLFVTRFPKTITFLSFFTFVVFVTGVIWTPPLNADINSVWLPANGWAKNEKAYKETNFGRGRLEQYIITAKNGGDLLDANKSALLETYDLFERITTFTIPDRKTGERYGYNDLCLKPIPIACLEYGPLDYWSKDREDIIADQDPHLTVSVDPFQSSLGPLNRSLILGGLQFDETGKVTFVAAFQGWIFLDNSDVRQQADPEHLELLEDWEAEYVRLMQEPMQYIIVVPQAQRSQADAINDAITADIPFLAMSLMLVIILFLAGLFRYDKGRSKVTLGFSGVFTILFTIGSTFGLFGWADITNYPGAFFVYFMLLALSINHHYLFIHASNRHKGIFDLSKRLGIICGEILPSIYISNLCPLVPLIILYSTTELDAMKSVTFAAFVGLIMELYYITTWFIPCVFFDSLRNRVGDQKVIRQYSNVDINESQKSNMDETSQLLNPEVKKPAPPRLLRRVSSLREPTILNVNFMDNSSSLSKFYKKYVFVPVSMVIIFLILAGFVIWGIVGITNWVQVFNRGDLSASSDYLNEYLRLSDKYFGELGVPLDLVIEQTIDGEDLLYNYTETGRAIVELERQFLANPYIRDYTLISWHQNFMQFVATNRATVDLIDDEGFPFPEQYDFCFDLWYSRPIQISSYFQDLQLYDEPVSRVRTAKFRIETIPLPTMELQTNAVVELHALTQSFTAPTNSSFGPIKTFVNGGPWAIFAAFEPVRVEGIRIAYIVPGVTLALALLVTNPISLFLIALVMASINVVMFGVAMLLSDISVTEASLPNIMMISIVAFSYCIHYEFGFAFYQGTKVEKAVDAIWSHGTAIVYASICTLIGCLPLLLASSGLDIVFSIMFISMIAIAAVYSVFLLPILLSIFGLPTRSGDYPEI